MSVLPIPQIKDDFLGRTMIHINLADTNPGTGPCIVSVSLSKYLNKHLPCITCLVSCQESLDDFVVLHCATCKSYPGVPTCSPKWHLIWGLLNACWRWLSYLDRQIGECTAPVHNTLVNVHALYLNVAATIYYLCYNNVHVHLHVCTATCSSPHITVYITHTLVL